MVLFTTRSEFLAKSDNLDLIYQNYDSPVFDLNSIVSFFVVHSNKNCSFIDCFYKGTTDWYIFGFQFILVLLYLKLILHHYFASSEYTSLLVTMEYGRIKGSIVIIQLLNSPMAPIVKFLSRNGLKYRIIAQYH